MTLSSCDVSAPVEASAPQPSIFQPFWAAMNDRQLLEHYRGVRGVHFDAVVDAEETRRERIDGIVDGDFQFNGETHCLGAQVDWLNNPSRDVEWHILLHKFYYAVGLAQQWQRSGDARYVQRWAELIDSWISVTPPGFIAADVTGRRVQNWIYSLQGLVLQRAGAPVDAGFFRRLLTSLHGQVEFLCANLTPKRNHRTLELLAIFLAGVVFPEMQRAAHWRRFALAETLANVQADLLPDGVHCELSSDYHCLALRNWMQVRQLAARNGMTVPAEMDAALQRAFDFALHVHRPDGVAPSLSDGDARSYLPLLALGAEVYGREDLRFVATAGREGQAPARRVAHFAQSGYHVLRSGWERAPHFADAQWLVFDCGPLGEGNHGHLDALSFELAAFGRPLLVDPGRYTYSEAGDVNWRVHFRGTAAHNTVGVDGLQQTRYAPMPIKEPSRHAQGSVRHKIGGPGPETTLIESASSPHLDLLHGRAVCRRPAQEYDAVHERCIVFVDQTYWIVSDRLRSSEEHRYALHFQLAAAAQGRTSLRPDAAPGLDSPGLSMALAPCAGLQVELADSWVSTLYGQKEPAPQLRCTLRGRHVGFDTVLLPSRGAAARVNVERTSGTALRITVEGRPGHDTWLHGHDPEAVSVDGIDFRGRWLLLRHAPDGTLLHATTHAGAVLDQRCTAVPVTHVAARFGAGKP